MRYRQSGEKCFMDGPHNAYLLTAFFFWEYFCLFCGLISFVYANIHGPIEDPYSLFLIVAIIGAAFAGLLILYMKRQKYAENLFEEIRNMDPEELKRQTKYSIFTVAIPLFSYPLLIVLLAAIIKAVFFS